MLAGPGDALRCPCRHRSHVFFALFDDGLGEDRSDRYLQNPQNVIHSSGENLEASRLGTLKTVETAAGEQERSQVKALLCDVRGGQSVTDETVKLVFADQSVGGGAFHGIRDAHGAMVAESLFLGTRL